MLKKLFTTLGIGLAVNGSADTAGYQPYPEPHVNFLYNLLFCDNLSLFNQGQNNIKGDNLWSTLFAKRPDQAALQRIANNETNEGRVRALAYNRLRATGASVPPKKLLGVIIEVPLQQGLDALAAYSEGGVRYLNQSGRVAIFEGTDNPVANLAVEIISIAQPVVNQIGPWDKQRLPPPKAGDARLTFVVSDGLYFGEGSFETPQQDAMSGPIIAKAGQLLQRIVELDRQNNP
jgi:hypothetical protein